MTAMAEVVIPGARADDGVQGFPDRVAESHRRVFQIARSVLANTADAEEITQEVFLKAFQKASSLRDPAKFHLWVSRMAFRLALNRQRSRKRQLTRDTAWVADAPSATTNEGDRAANRIYLERLRDEIDRLPEKLRVVLLLSAVEGLEAAEISGILDIPAGTVRSRLHLARKQLLGVLKL